ncbi:MAG TPA: hypothetical protein VFW86_01525, partial [Candidatus Limnocylindrales bacterium]|nr:hypothetical protein [Candidatus Limnocylindrales bacterium]
EIKQLVSLRKDTLSHAYELLKVEDPRRRRRLAEQVARGELSLVRLRQRIEGRTAPETVGEAAPTDDPSPAASPRDTGWGSGDDAEAEATSAWTGHRPPAVVNEDSLIAAKGRLAEALDELVGVLGSPDAIGAIGEVDRGNLAKYLTIAKLRLENAIALVRSAERGS